MKFLNCPSLWKFRLSIFLAACFLQRAQGLQCYTCDSDMGRDGNTAVVDKFCEKGVTSSPDLLTTCDSGKNAVCSTMSYSGTAPGSKLKIFKRSCHYMNKGKTVEGCVSLSSGALKDTRSGDYTPTFNPQTGQSDSPFHVCFCKADGCNSEDNYSNDTTND